MSDTWRCPKCFTHVAAVQGLRFCYVCGTSLDDAVVVVGPPWGELQARRDGTTGTVLLCILAGVGTLGLLSLIASAVEIYGRELLLLVPFVMAVVIVGFIFRFSKNQGLEAAGRVMLGVAAVAGLLMVAMVVLAIALLVFLFAVCAAGGGL